MLPKKIRSRRSKTFQSTTPKTPNEFGAQKKLVINHQSAKIVVVRASCRAEKRQQMASSE